MYLLCKTPFIIVLFKSATDASVYVRRNKMQIVMHMGGESSHDDDDDDNDGR